MIASHLSVTIGGESIDSVLLGSVEVLQELNKHWWCHVECRSTPDQRLPVEEWLGKDLRIVSYDQERTEHLVFDGFVLKVSLEYEISGSYKALLKAVSRSYKLGLTPQHAYYLKNTLQEIASQLTEQDGLTVGVTCGDKKPLNYVQWAESNWDFLNRLADDHHAWLRPSASGIEIFDSFQGGTTLLWRGESGERGLLSFRIEGMLGQASFNGAHYNHHEMKSQGFKRVHEEAHFFDSSVPLVEAVKRESQDKLPPGYGYQRSRVVTLEDYEKLLEKESVRSIGRSIVGTGESRNQELLPGNMVEIEGNLDAHGKYGVTKVVHRWSSTGYLNEFWCTPWNNYTAPNRPEVQPWYGVVPARVIEHNDPKKMGRIKVQYFWQGDGPAHWARMLTPHAGSDRGFMFMPEVGDEVAVAFEDGDPERPYILGCVWNGVDQAPRQDFWGDDIAPNDVKRIVTKSGNRIQMIDKKGKESIVLSTPNSIRVALISHANETKRETLLLDSSDGDIILNAPNGRIHFHCKYISREVGG